MFRKYLKNTKTQKLRLFEENLSLAPSIFTKQLKMTKNLPLNDNF